MLGSLVSSLAIGAGLYSQSPHAEKERQKKAIEEQRKAKVEDLMNQYKGLEEVSKGYDEVRDSIMKDLYSTSEKAKKSGNLTMDDVMKISKAHEERMSSHFADVQNNISGRMKIANELVGLGQEDYIRNMKALEAERGLTKSMQSKYSSGFNSRGLEETAKAMEEKRMQNKQNAVQARREAIEKNIFKTLYKQED